MAIVLVMVLVLAQDLTSFAREEPSLIKKRATAYCLKGKTCTGIEVRHGICATGDKELIGKTIILYQRLPGDEIGKIIGIYEVEDSGCSSNVIDVWQQDLEECQNFMNLVYEDGCQGKVWVQIFECCG